MSESTRRRKYRYDRVLIETARVLDPQFDDALVYLTGAQIEMLRNMTQYLNRLDTYVTVYNVGFYLTPTVEEYDSILAIVADMEEELMGNPNTIWGYKDTKHGLSTQTVSGTGDRTLYPGTVPADEVWRLEGWTAKNDATACSRIELAVGLATGVIIVYQKDNPGVDELVSWEGMLTLKEGSVLNAVFYGVADGDYIRTDVRGYTVAVPE